MECQVPALPLRYHNAGGISGISYPHVASESHTSELQSEIFPWRNVAFRSIFPKCGGLQIVYELIRGFDLRLLASMEGAVSNIRPCLRCPLFGRWTAFLCESQ